MKQILAGVKSIGLAILTAFLGAWAGAEGTNKNWRRVLLPLIITLLAYLQLKSLWCLLIMFLSVAFSTGYGIPDATDEGSALGKFWYKFFKGNELLANMGTRGTIGAMVNTSLTIIPILKGNWNLAIPCFWVIKMVYILFSWRDLGGIWVKNKYLLTCDLLVYGIIGLVAGLIIYL